MLGGGFDGFGGVVLSVSVRSLLGNVNLFVWECMLQRTMEGVLAIAKITSVGSVWNSLGVKWNMGALTLYVSFIGCHFTSLQSP